MPIRLDPEDHELTALTDLAGAWLNGRILEVGCGAGRLTWRYARQAAHVTAIDPDPARIAAARTACPAALAPRVTLVAAGIHEFETPERFDLALLSWSL